MSEISRPSQRGVHVFGRGGLGGAAPLGEEQNYLLVSYLLKSCRYQSRTVGAHQGEHD